MIKRRASRGYIESRGGILVPASRMSGRFKLEAIRPDGRVRPLTGWFRNLITNSGLDAIGVSADWLANCRVGSGNSAPDVGDTSLDAEIASTNTVVGNVLANSGASLYFTSRAIKFRFSTGAAEGNLAELGIFRSNPPFSMFSRALILDGDGDPTTVTVLSDEVLDVTYEWRNYPVLEDVESSVTISGEDYDVTTRPSNVGSTSWGGSGGGTLGGAGGGIAVYDGAIGPVTGAPAGSTSGSNDVTAGGYTSGNYFAEYSVSLALDQGNFGGGIRSVFFGLGNGGGGTALGFMQSEFDPPIPKTSSDILSLQFRHTWARKDL